MRLWPFRRQREKPDPAAFMAELRRAWEGAGYGPAERRADFERVFLGSDAGRRVLYQLFHWGGMYAPGWVPGDPYALHVREGSRELCFRILAALHGGAGERPEQVRSERPEE